MIDKSEVQLVRIVQAEGDGVKLGRGTKVLLPSGEEIPSIISVAIDPVGADDFWVATIRCGVAFDYLDCYTMIDDVRHTWWRRWLLRLAHKGI